MHSTQTARSGLLRKEVMKVISESALRRRAKRQGYLLRKSRARIRDSNNRGMYVLYNAHSGNVVLGPYFDASLEDIENFLNGG
jgi:hypothetical protein